MTDGVLEVYLKKLKWFFWKKTKPNKKPKPNETPKNQFKKNPAQSAAQKCVGKYQSRIL